MLQRYCFYFFFIFSTFVGLQSLSAQNETKEYCNQLIREGKDLLHRENYSNSIKTLTKARIIAHNHKWSNEEFLAIDHIGENYYMLQEYGEALDYLTEAYALALKVENRKNEMVALNNIGILYSDEQKFDKANDYFIKAYETAKEIKDNQETGIFALNIGDLKCKQSDFVTAQKYYNEAVILLKTSMPKVSILAEIGLANCYVALGNSSKAKNEAFRLLHTSNDLKFYETEISLNNIIAKAFLRENKINEAYAFAKKSLSGKPNLITKTKVFGLLSEISFKKGSFKEALAYKDSIIETNLKREKIKNARLFESSIAEMDIENYKNKLAVNESKLMTTKRIYVSILVIVLIAMGLVIWILKSRLERNKQKKSIAEKDKHILKLRLENEINQNEKMANLFKVEKNITLMEHEQLMHEIDLRNKKLSVKALGLSDRNKRIEDILVELSKLLQVSKNETLKKNIQELKSILNSEEEWGDFLTHFEEVNQDFVQKLKIAHPNLTANDIRFLSYVYMNLNNKEIASMLHISQDSCRKRKERILQKMALPNSQNLYEYLIDLK